MEWLGRVGKGAKQMKNRIYDDMRTFNLQIFAEEGEPEAETSADSGDDAESKDEPEKRTYDDKEVDRIVAKHKAEWEKKHAKDLEAAKEEARKYERMTKEQRDEADKKKAADEVAQRDARIQELEREIALDALRKSVAAEVEAMPEGIHATQEFLDLVVANDAETSDANVKKLVGLILADRKAQEEKRATGRTPKSFGGNGSTMSEIEKRLAKYK